jgi:vacuolar-type H+-ATPase subunit E/Vma4
MFFSFMLNQLRQGKVVVKTAKSDSKGLVTIESKSVVPCLLSLFLTKRERAILGAHSQRYARREVRALNRFRARTTAIFDAENAFTKGGAFI